LFVPLAAVAYPAIFSGSLHQEFFSGVYTRNFFGGFTPGIFFWGLHQKFFRGFTPEIFSGVYTRNFFGGFTPGIFFGGLHQEFFRGFTPGIFSGVQKIQLRTEGRENGDLGAVAPYSGVPLNLQMNGIHILIMLLRMYIPRNGEFGSALAKLQNFRGGG
jgi:hypothetical protein